MIITTGAVKNPTRVKSGDVFIATVTLHVMNVTQDGKLWLAAYNVPYPDPELDNGIPQGDSIPEELVEAVAQAVIPAVAYAHGVIPYRD